MPIDITSQKNSIIAVVVALVVLGGGFYAYTSLSSADGASQATVMDNSLLDSKIKTFLSVKDTIDFKDTSFSKSPFYSQLVDYTEHITLITARGRDNPFIPYVAPGSIR